MASFDHLGIGQISMDQAGALFVFYDKEMKNGYEK